MANVISPNMNLIIPGVGTEPGPTYASDINASLTLIDGHNHTAGNGVLITPAAININAPLAMNNFALISIKSLTLLAQGSAPANDSLYISGVDLHYVDGNGNDIPITASGVVNATSSGISSGTATASFVSSVLVVNAAALTPANIQGGSILLGNNTASSKFLTLSPPSAMVANYGLILPNIPAATSYVTLDTAGNFSTLAPTVKSIGATVGIGGIARSAVTGTVSGSTVVATVHITTTGNPVLIQIISSADPGYFLGDGASTAVEIKIIENGSGAPLDQEIPVNDSFRALPSLIATSAPAPGANTYTVTLVPSGGNVSYAFALLVYELL